MRKWMRDRLKRPKKTADAGKSEPAQAPLQPAYYDAPDASNSASVRIVEENTEPSFESETPHRAESSVPAETSPAAESAVSTSQRPAANGDPRRRRRRGRGGRGRGSASAAKVERPAATGTVPESVDAGVALAEEAPGAASTVAPSAPRASKGTVVLAIGLPGSGKSSWFKRHSINPLSSDMLRALLFDDPTEQRFQDLIFSNLRSMLKARLIARRPLNYVDATNLTPHERQSWIKLAQDYGYEVQAVFFDVPLEVCLERNHKRERVVADDVMRRMSGKLKAPTFAEGFSKITVVRVKRKE
jgi:predicted kinase